MALYYLVSTLSSTYLTRKLLVCFHLYLFGFRFAYCLSNQQSVKRIRPRNLNEIFLRLLFFLFFEANWLLIIAEHFIQIYLAGNVRLASIRTQICSSITFRDEWILIQILGPNHFSLHGTIQIQLMGVAITSRIMTRPKECLELCHSITENVFFLG